MTRCEKSISVTVVTMGKTPPDGSSPQSSARGSSRRSSTNMPAVDPRSVETVETGEDDGSTARSSVLPASSRRSTVPPSDGRHSPQPPSVIPASTRKSTVPPPENRFASATPLGAHKRPSFGQPNDNQVTPQAPAVARKPTPVPGFRRPTPLPANVSPTAQTVRLPRSSIPPPGPPPLVETSSGQTPSPSRVSSPAPAPVEPRLSSSSAYGTTTSSSSSSPTLRAINVRSSSSSSTHAIDAGLSTPAQRVLDELVQLDRNERLVIVHDQANESIANAFELAGLERGARVVRVDAEAAEPRPWVRCPQEALDAAASADATIFVTTSEEGEYDARHAFVTASMAARARHVHMVGTSRRAFIGSLVTNPQRIFDLMAALRAALRPQSRLQVRSPAGTLLEVEMAPHLRWFSMGNPLQRGQWLNVPYGALVSSPASVTGTYVVDTSMGGGLGSRLGSLANRPIRIVFDAGKVKSIDCRDSNVESYVKKFIGEGIGHDRVGLIQLGANIGVAAPLGEYLYDQVMPGVHLCLGDPLAPRTGAHWNAYGQLPFAVADCDVDIDGEPLIRHGRYVRLV